MRNKLILATILFLGVSSVSHTSGRLRLHQLKSSLSNEVEDVKTEIFFGEKLASGLLSEYELMPTGPLTKYINKVGAGVASFLGRNEIKHYFGILDTDEINAFAAPGGFIFITKGALKKIQNEDQLVGVLAHEISHVTRKHVVKSLGMKGRTSDLTSSLVSIIGGGTSNFIEVLDKGLEYYKSKKLNKRMERECDYDAIKTLIALGYSPAEYLKFVSNLSTEKNKTKTLTKTHPLPEERQKFIRKIMKRYGQSIAPLSRTSVDRYQGFIKRARF